MHFLFFSSKFETLIFLVAIADHEQSLWIFHQEHVIWSYIQFIISAELPFKNFLRDNEQKLQLDKLKN